MVEQRENIISQSLIVIGAGGHAASIAEVAYSAGFQLQFFVDPEKANSTLFGFPIVESLNGLNFTSAFSLCIAIGDNAKRERIANEMRVAFRQAAFPTLIHRSAVVSHYAKVGEGAVLMPGAVVGAGSEIGKFCIVNTNASVDHDCSIHDFSSIAPGVSLGGGVQLGRRSEIGIGATVRQGIIIGCDSIIGAKSYLNKDVANNLVAYGTPARIIRDRSGPDLS